MFTYVFQCIHSFLELFTFSEIDGPGEPKGMLVDFCIDVLLSWKITKLARLSYVFGSLLALACPGNAREMAGHDPGMPGASFWTGLSLKNGGLPMFISTYPMAWTSPRAHGIPWACQSPMGMANGMGSVEIDIGGT